MTTNSIRIKILVDNRAGDGLIKEHGLAVWIEAFGNRILFDTGQGKALLPNAAALGIDLSITESMVLSHGHYDHTGGVPDVLRQNAKVKIYSHPSVVNTRYILNDNAAPKNISMPEKTRLTMINLSGDQYYKISHPERIYHNIGLLAPIPQSNLLEYRSGPFYLDEEGKNPDPIDDDLALWIQSEGGLIVITGCCHSGLINTVNYARRVSNEKKVRAIIGGLHLMEASNERLEATAQALLEWDIKTIIPCHCTGEDSIDYLKQKLGEKVIGGFAGLEWSAG